MIFKMASRLRLVGSLRQLATRQLSVSAASRQLVKPPLQLYGIEGRYAHALYSAASKNKSLDAVEGEISKLNDLLKKDRLLSAFIMDPSVNKLDKQDILAKTLKEQKYSELTSNFIVMLAENSRLPRTTGIIQAFETLMRSHRGEVQCTVTTAKDLDSATMKNLTESLKRFIKEGEKLIITTKIDPSVIGGVVVDVGEYHIDMSIAAKIKKISSSLRAEI